MSNTNVWKSALVNPAATNFNPIDLTYTWEIATSSKTIDDSALIKFNNSVAIPSELLESSSLYTVKLNVTDGTSNGFCYQTYRTNPDISFEFRVSPSSGYAIDTSFTFIVTEQSAYGSLNMYSYGYINELGNNVPLFQKT